MSLLPVFAADSKITIYNHNNLPEQKLVDADNLQDRGQTAQAIEIYSELLKMEELPPELYSLVLLRIADAQMKSGKVDDYKKTLDQIKALDILPKHHRLLVAELEAALAGQPNPTLKHTPVPVFDQVAKRLFVAKSASLKDADGSRKRPHASIQNALQHAREFRREKSLPPGTIEISLLDRKYPVQETIILGSEDSGTKRNPLVIRSSDKMEKTIITGGCDINKWRKEEDPAILARLPESSRGSVLAASLKENGTPYIGDLTFGGFSSQRSERGSHRFTTFPVVELFHRGVALPMARWPNDGDTGLLLEGFDDDRPLRWQNESDLWLHGYWYWAWADAYEKVESIDAGNRRITLEPPHNRYGFRESQWHAVNALSEIDIPGEWHLDIPGQKIRFLPPEDFDAEECTLSAYGPVIIATECDFVAIQDMEICYVSGDGMIFRDCNDITVSNCDIRSVSGNGLRIEGGLRCLLHSITIEHMGRGGIDIRSGDWVKLIPSGSIIENCSISDLSRIDRTYTPALLLEGMGLTVRHCRFSEIPSSAIRLEASESLIEMNEFTNCVEESDDQGAIDVWANPLYRDNVIRWNYFHDITGRHGMVSGIRLDDAISGFMITGNIFMRSAGGIFGGIQVHGGRDNYVEGNIFVDCPTAYSHTPWGKDHWRKMLTDHQYISNLLRETPWQSAEWQERYPALKHLMNDAYADRNFVADNLAVNCEQFYLRHVYRKGPLLLNTVTLNNRIEARSPAPRNLKDVKSLPGRRINIPFDSIGNYE